MMTFLKQQTFVSRGQAPPTRFASALLTAALAAMLSACGSSAHIPVATRADRRYT